MRYIPARLPEGFGPLEGTKEQRQAQRHKGRQASRQAGRQAGRVQTGRQANNYLPTSIYLFLYSTRSRSLAVPPYHWHRVSSVGDAIPISVAVYSESGAMKMYDAMKAVSFPFPRDASIPHLAWALKTWLCALARRASLDCSRWATTLWSQRYELLGEEEVGIVRGWELFAEPARRKFDAAVEAFPIDEASKRVERGRARLIRAANALFAKVQGIVERSGEVFELAVFETELGSLAEDLANALLGTGTVDAFLRYLAAAAELR